MKTTSSLKVPMICKLLLIFIVTINFVSAKTNYYDSVMGKKVFPECGQFLSERSVSRSFFHIQQLTQDSIALKDIKLGKHFYHYTNSSVVAEYFFPNVPDRSHAQDQIQRAGNLEKILTFSFKNGIINLAGPGFYLAANPFSSREYGKNQIHFELDPEARVYQDLRVATTDHSPRLAQIKKQLADSLRNLAPQTSFVPCREDTLIGIALQESGIDLVYYDQNHSWVALFNEDVVRSSDVIFDIEFDYQVIKKLAHADRLGELDARSSKMDSAFAYYSIHFENDVNARKVLRWLLSQKAFNIISAQIRGGYWDSNPRSSRYDQAYIDLILSIETADAPNLSRTLCEKIYRRKNILGILASDASKEEKKALKTFERQFCR
jgi:hypothetical protein